MKKKQLLKNIEKSNLSADDKRFLTKLIKQNRFDEYIKLIVKILGLGSVFWD